MNYLNILTIFIRMIKKFSLLILVMGFTVSPVLAQNSDSENTTINKPLRSDVGIVGITANFNGLSDFTYTGQQALQKANGSVFEIELRDVRTMSPHLGVGFEILGSFITGGSKGFALDGWGAGPVVRAYPFETPTWQPYGEMDLIIGHELGLGKLSKTKNGGQGFRSRRGIRVGLAYRFQNNYGFFVEGGYEWEGDRLFHTDAKALQLNFGFDLYLFN